ncbi:MAG: HDIG domain-containing protein, partial [Mycoplasmoidaceae bacterium]|nr:HDIG domain-containing protein [Mycoplasmoidaceae bacterium]
LEKLIKKNQILDQKLSEISGYSKEQARKELMDKLDKELSGYINQKIIDANALIKQEKEEYARQIIVEAMEDIAEESVISRTTYTIPLKSENVKGHIIGKNGKNITTFKEITGVDVIIDKEQTITLSSLNPKKREIAFMTMSKLLTKNIDPVNIQKIYDEEVINFKQRSYEYGHDAIENTLKIFDLDKEIYSFVGTLYFRTSFGQNVLSHSIEVAKICKNIADQLNVDANKAKKIGLLHDIGKSCDYENDCDHVKQGIKIIKKFIKDPDYINAIESHHNQVPENNIYS